MRSLKSKFLSLAFLLVLVSAAGASYTGSGNSTSNLDPNLEISIDEPESYEQIPLSDRDSVDVSISVRTTDGDPIKNISYERDDGTRRTAEVQGANECPDGSTAYSSSQEPEYQCTDSFTTGSHWIQATAWTKDGRQTTDKRNFKICENDSCDDGSTGQSGMDNNACSPGADTDNDDYSRSNDPGCDKPYWRDKIEMDGFDTDVSYLFSSRSQPSAIGPSAFYAGAAFENLGYEGEKRDSASGDSAVNEYFINNAGEDSSNTFGAGTIESVNGLGQSNTDSVDEGGRAELRDKPRTEDCGDGIPQSDEDNQNCPQDYGLPSDKDGETKFQSVNTITDSVGSYSGEPFKFVDEQARSGDNIVWTEWHADGSLGTDSIDITEENDGLDYTVSPGTNECVKSPDFYLEDSDRIFQVECDQSIMGTEIVASGLQDKDNPEDESIAEYDSTPDGTRYRCVAGPNATCVNNQDFATGRTSTASVDHHVTREVDKTVQITSEEHWTVPSGSSYSSESEPRTWTLTYSTDVEYGTTDRPYYNALTYTSYPTECRVLREPGSCSSSPVDVYTSKDGSQDYAGDYETSNVDVEMDTVPSTPWVESKVFHTDPSKSNIDNINALFGGDSLSRDVIAKKGGFYSIVRQDDPYQQENDESTPVSEFDVFVDSNNDFRSDRTRNDIYNPDGPEGQSDGYLALNSGSIVGSTPGLASLETLNGNSAGFVSNPPPEGCPGNYEKCVASVDIGFKSFNQWNQDDPSSGVEYEYAAGNPYGTGESFSACMMYKRLGGDVQCTFSTGSGPIPSGPTSDQEGEMRVVFEGPEVNEERAREYPHIYEGSTTSPNACFFNGSVYGEGSVVDIGQPLLLNKPEDNWGTFEAGGWSTDEEVCADLDEDSRGEWHDIDKDTLNNYARENLSSYTEVAAKFVSNPDSSADPSTGVIKKTQFAIEDDCAPTSECEDQGAGTGFDEPFVGQFIEGSSDDDYTTPGFEKDTIEKTNLPNVHNRVQTGDETGHGSSNDQDQETPLNLGVLENSRVDPEDDEWALTPSLQYGIANDGTPYQGGRCYNDGRVQGEDINKREAVYANSYIEIKDVYTQGQSASLDDGNWVDPDTNNNSVDGQVSCDLTGQDSGYGFDKGSTLKCLNGDCDRPATTDTVFAVEGPITFDINSNPGDQDPSNDLPQYKDACGDDPNEYLIREHTSSVNENEFEPVLTRDNIFVCADRPTDCAFNGEVYSEGQTRDISSVTDEEAGQPLNDPEICVDVDPSKPGGEWLDMDQDLMSNRSLSTDSETWDALYRFRNETYWSQNPGTDKGLDSISYFNVNDDTISGSSSGSIKPYGYSTEDDCTGLEACDDVGDGLSQSQWFNAGIFREGAEQDNFDTGENVGGVHNKLNDSSDQFEPGAATQSNFESIYGDTAIYDYQDSTPGPDNWGLTPDLTYSIGNNGTGYRSGQCYARDGYQLRSSPENSSDTKLERVFGNSYADSDGVWQDPDDLGADQANFTCDLTGPDRGYGYNTDSGNPSNWNWKNNDESTETVIGDIAFASVEGKSGGYAQEPPMCGDDNYEYLIEELGEAPNSEVNEGRWGCGTSTAACVARGADSENQLFQQGDYVDTRESTEEVGRLKNDKEYCLMKTDTWNDSHGVWYDQDFNQTICRENILYGNQGVRWFGQDYIKEYPLAVQGGIDDDMNDYIGNRPNYYKEFESDPTKQDPSDYDFSTETPVPTGDNRTVTATFGFCGGDDASEYLTTMECESDYCETDRSIQGVAAEPGSCVFDEESTRYETNTEYRNLYNPGETVTIQNIAGDPQLACFNGVWFDEWPIHFSEETVDVELGSTRSVAFEVINVRNREVTFQVSMGESSETPSAYQFSRFGNTAADSFETTIDPVSSRTYNVEITGGNTNVDDSEITVTADAVNMKDFGSDSTTVDIVRNVSTGENRVRRNVPGIQVLEIVLLFGLASLLFLREV